MLKRTILVLLFFTILFTFPFFKSGYFATQDGEWAIVRLAEMGRELRDFQIPPRWSDFLNHGYGYPLFLFTYPFPYYAGALIHVIGFSLTTSIKILFVASVFISALGMFFFSKRYWGNFGALISSVLYIVVPYRLIDLYIRGSLGECIALAVFPWLLWATDKYIYKEAEGFLIPLLFTVLITSHNASAFIFLIILFFYLILSAYRNKKDYLRVFKPFFYGLLLSSYFLLPILLEKRYIYLGTFPIADRNIHFAQIADLVLLNSTNSIKPPLFIGYIHLFVIFFSLLVIKKTNNKIKSLVIFSVVSLAVLFFLLFKQSAFLWQLPLLNNIDFPWRVLVGIAFLSSFLGGAVTQIRYHKLIGIIIIFLSVYLQFPLIRTANHIVKDDSYYYTNDSTTTSNNELMPIWVNQKPRDRQAEKVLIKDGEVSNIFYTSKDIEFDLSSNIDQEIIINTLYFPGWKFYVNGKEVPISPTKNSGLISFNAASGLSKINGKFTRTYVRLIADLTSIIGMGFIILNVMEYLKNKYK